MSINVSEFDSLFLDAPASVPAIGRLGGGTLRRDAQGQLVRTSGRHTVVYELHLSSGRIMALRMHRRSDRRRDIVLSDRYAALQSDRRLDPLRAPYGPLPGDIRWLPEGVRVQGADNRRQTLPLLAMEHVPGRTLRQTVERLCHEGDTTHLGMIADRWLEAGLAMEAAGFVHGDLGAENIMVRPDGSITVVDLDHASWPGFDREELDDSGSISALRHPQGPPGDPARRDRFPALMLWAALRILATHPELLTEINSDETEGLLFSDADLRRPSASQLFSRLDQADPGLRLLLEVVRRAIRFSPEELPPLSEIATRLDNLGYSRVTPKRSARASPSKRFRPEEPTTAPVGTEPPKPGDAVQPAPAAREQAETQAARIVANSTQEQRLEDLQAALVRRDGREARRIRNELRELPVAQVLAASVHQLTEQEARSAIERALRRRDDAALLHVLAQAEAAGVAPPAEAAAAAREARRRTRIRTALNAALNADDWLTLANLQRTGQLEDLGPLEPSVNRAIARALAWPSLNRALSSDNDAAICAAADPAIWREEETRPQSIWQRLELAWHRTRWAQDVRAALRRRDAPYLRGLMSKAPADAEERLTEVERRRVQRVITRDQATARLEHALREGPDREVVEALAELEASGAPFSDVLDWSVVRGVVDRLSLADSLRAAMDADPPDTARMARLLPAARAALGDLRSAGAEWAELEQAVLRAAHLERLREAIASGEDARIAAAADPDPFQVRELLSADEAGLVAAVLGRTRTQMRRHAS